MECSWIKYCWDYKILGGRKNMKDDKYLARSAFVNYLNKLSDFKQNKEFKSNKTKNKG